MEKPELIRYLEKHQTGSCTVAAQITTDPIGIAIPIPIETADEVIKEVDDHLVRRGWCFDIVTMGRAKQKYFVLFPYGN